jgi:hypothetical protein
MFTRPNYSVDTSIKCQNAFRSFRGIKIQMDAQQLPHLNSFYAKSV